MSMRLRALSWAAVVTLLALGGCSNALANLRTRASFDLGCPENQLKQYKLGGGAWGVTGCGKKATYVLAGVPPHRSWVLNGIQGTSGGSAP